MTWKQTTLLDVTTRIGDGLHGTPKYDDDGSYFFVNGNNLIGGKVLIQKDTKRINNEEFIKIKKELNDRTIFVSINGTLGNVALYNNEMIALGKSTCYLNVQENVSRRFIRYSLEYYKFQNYAQSFATGSTIKNLGLEAIRAYEFFLPPLHTQERIADILSAYDDLIETNLKRIKLLEQAAQNIYKEWLVNLRYPGHEQTPINPKTGLPDGWEKKLANHYFDFKRGIEVGSENYVNKKSKNSIPFLRVGSLGSRDTDIFTDISLVKDSILSFSDICISMDGSIGLVGYGLVGAYSTGLRKVMPKTDKYRNGFIFCLLKSQNIQDTIRAFAKGSTILHASSSMKHLCFNDAPNKISSQFNSVVEPLYNQMLTLHKQNQKLRYARDILLPRLMNQTIKV